MAEMYYRLEKAAMLPERSQGAAAAPAPAAAPPPPAAAPPPPAAAPTAATAAAPPLPRAEAAPPPPAAAPPAPAQSPPPPAPPAKREERGGFGWLRRSAKPKAPPLEELLAEGGGPDTAFARAVASELAVDAPEGLFDSVPGLKVPPPGVPVSMRAALLHAAVKAEAESLGKVERAEGITKVAKSMVMVMVDTAEAEKDKEKRLEALDRLVLYLGSAEQLCEELAPDVEPEKVAYEGGLRPKKLEELYVSYLDRSVAEAQEQSAMAMAAMWGGAGEDSSMAAMEARMAQSEKRRAALAALCGLSEDKAQKLLEKKTQQELLAGLGNLGDLGKLAELGAS